MTTITGTSGDDDGGALPALRVDGWAATVFGLEGDDVLISGSRPFDESPDVLHGGGGDDTYVITTPGSFPIYSTPIIWVLFQADVDIHETIRAEDGGDVVDLTRTFTTINTNITFDGSGLYLTGWAGVAQEVRIFDNYGVDEAGDLLAGVDQVLLNDYYGGTTVELNLRLEDPFLNFIRNGTAADDGLTGGEEASLIDGRGGDDRIEGLGGNDFLAAGLGDDVVRGGEGHDRAFGGGGRDKLWGGDGDDELAGMDGRDRLVGGDGADTLDGGRGVDQLNGGVGADVFRFGLLAKGADRIDDFSVGGGDRLDLSALLEAFDPSADDIADFVRITEIAGVSYLDVDKDGAGGHAGFTGVAVLVGVSGLLDVQALLDAGTLIV